MHLPNITAASLDDLIEPVDLGQAPAEMLALSFSDSDLGGAGGGVGGGARGVPELRLAQPARAAPSDVGRSVDRARRRRRR